MISFIIIVEKYESCTIQDTIKQKNTYLVQFCNKICSTEGKYFQNKNINVFKKH